jgi:hypothetical protein
MNTSSIENLPTDPSISQTTTAISSISNQGTPNVVLETTEKSQIPNDNVINSQFEKELQMAVNQGNTSLPSRDIPSDTTPIINDEQIQPNYIPGSSVDHDYVQNYENSNDFLNYKEKEVNRSDNVDFVYEQLKLPILLSFLFFIFQLPFIKNMLLTHSPMLFNTDGNYNLYGYGLSSILFGLIFYLISNLLDYFGNI